MLLLFGSQIMGSSAIQNYQSLLYSNLGFEGNTVLLITGVYGLMGFIGQLGGLFILADRWPRVRTLYVGCTVNGIMLSILMPLSKAYGESQQGQSGSRAGVAFIFLYSGFNAAFLNGTMYVVASELFPLYLRTYGNSLAIFAMSAGQLLMTEITPLAFDAIAWKYYAIFIPCCFLLALYYAFFLPETGSKSLEEIAEAFGDKVAVHDKDLTLEVGNEENKLAETGIHADVGHIERDSV
jgi:MFS family permease